MSSANGDGHHQQDGQQPTGQQQTGQQQTGQQPTGQQGGDLAALCEQAVAFSRSLPGPLRRVAVRSGDASVEVDWHEPAAPAGHAGHPAAAAGEHPPAAVAPGVTLLTQVVEADDVHLVSAPLVGTFYAAPSPGADPFVTVGSPVSVGQTLGIVEAMKLLNPIVSDVEGHVVEVLVANGQSVEFEQPLVRIALAASDAHPVDVAQAG